ncbi:MAG: GMC family oxidoreductase [Deltaproteobacteria bacterium]|nr:GMC family oxidoreductase [Deltaproteobacteria bacterium]
MTIETHETLTKDLRAAADVVVIGSGAAGAVVARILAKAKLDVIVVEEGPPPDRTRTSRSVQDAMFLLGRDRGLQVAMGRSFIPVLQGRCVGGSTTINAAIVWRLPEDAWARVFKGYGLGDAVPLEGLEREWTWIEEELNVNTVDRPRLGRNGELFLEAFQKAGYAAEAIKRNEKDCIASSNCILGCPGGKKMSTDVALIPRAIADGARVFACTRVDRIEVKDGRAKIVHATVINPESMARVASVTIEARRAVVVAASAIQTPCILLKSGLGNRAHVGQHFRVHPGTAIGGIFKDEVRPWQGVHQAADSLHFRKEGFKFETINLPPEMSSVRATGIGARFIEKMMEYKHLALWAMHVRAKAEGSVSPRRDGSATIRYTPGPADMQIARRALKILAERFFDVGAESVVLAVYGLPDRLNSPDELKVFDDAPLDPRSYPFIATHLFGTARMGPDPASSAVGADFQLHGVPGLYVADSALFPENLGVNPQHTIMGVAALCARRILG